MDQTTWLWTPITDQDILSPYNINTVSSGQAIRGLLDPIPNSPNYHHKNCIADSKENYYWDVGRERVKWYYSVQTIYCVIFSFLSPRADMKADEWVTRLIDDKWVVNLSCPNNKMLTKVQVSFNWDTEPYLRMSYATMKVDQARLIITSLSFLFISHISS